MNIFYDEQLAKEMEEETRLQEIFDNRMLYEPKSEMKKRPERTQPEMKQPTRDRGNESCK